MTKRRSTARPALRAGILFIFLLCTAPRLWSDGLPGEYLLSERWRILHSGYSPLPNPAILTEANYVAVRAALTRTLHEFNKLELGVTIPLGLYQSLGVTWLALGTSPYQSVQDGVDAGGEVNANDNFFMFSYAINPWRRLSIGVNVNVAHQNLFGESSRYGVGLDLGLSYRAIRHPLLGTHLVGVAMANLVPPNFGEAQNDTIGLPNERQATSLDLSLHSTYWEKRIETAIGFSLEDLYATTDDFISSDNPSGTAKEMEWEMNMRLGVWLLRMIKLYGLFGFEQTGFEYGGFALGFNLPSVNAGRDLSFLYQMISMKDGEANSHGLYLRTDIGLHREEAYARRMARLLNIEPNDLYNRALALYTNGEYWDAFFVFGRIEVEYPDFFKRDWVSYYMASCLEMLDMRDKSSNEYISAMRDYPKSTIRPYAELGLMRVQYRQENLAGVAMQFNRLNQPTTPDSLKYHAFYLMAQAAMQTGDQRKAKQMLERIPPIHPEYLFAQHSLAVINTRANDMEAAIENLRVCINAIARTKAHQEIVNRSLVFLGYLYYELSGTEGALSQAVTALRNVPQDSYYYEDALLGQGWTAVRARQWQDCVDAARLLIQVSNKPPLQAEARLLEAYAHMMRKDYGSAASVLKTAVAELDKYVPLSDSELESRERGYEMIRVDYDDIARHASKLAASRQSEHVTRLIDSLSQHQRDTKTTIDTHLLFLDEHQRNTFFRRNLDKVREDIEYALAVVEKLGGTSNATKLQREVQDEQRKIDEELRKLREEMKEMDEQPQEQP